jgi:hypothetical protein
MKSHVLTFFALSLLFCVASVSAQDKPLTNDDIITLSKAGVAEEVIVAKIKTTPASFDTSVEQLQRLKEAGVANNVTVALLQFPDGSKSAVAVTDDVIPGETKAVVYIYRRVDKIFLHPSVFVDGTEIARTDDGQFFVMKLDPGMHYISANKGNSGGKIDFKAGRRYFFRSSFEPGFWKGHGTLELVPRETASLEVAKMKPLEDKWIKNRIFIVTEYPQP